ncbi:MAG: nickel-responsive transcriptional regulator NikR [Methylacidiphilales bacterium]|nr:nickel-responsive transcriptional regulator NikR [Candidatus Methylacidiphilales bacterium]
MGNIQKEPSVRFTVSLHPVLLRRFDSLVRRTSPKNRSLEVADMIRSRLIEESVVLGRGEVMGTITLLYDHHHHHIQETLTDLQHHYRHLIITTLHVHIDHRNCMEVLVVRGKGQDVKKLSNLLGKSKGVKNGKLTVTGTGKKLPP